MLTQWLDDVLTYSVAGAGIALNQLSTNDKQVEMASICLSNARWNRCVWMR